MNMRALNRGSGFALPTVIIASVVMFAVLVSVVSSVSSARVSLDSQYYDQLLGDATDSGVARAKDCVINTTMTINTAVKPSTNCDGVVVSGKSVYVATTPNFRTSYTMKLTSSTSQLKTLQVDTTLELLRTSNGSVARTVTKQSKLSAIMKIDPDGDRPSQRYWYFGDAAILDFGSTGSNLPSPIANPSAASPAPFAYEGTTTVSDQNGNVVFWTDGRTIWDKTGNVMLNSTGLLGASSATQAASSFPLNPQRSMYGVVSNSGQRETGSGELYLSVINTALNSGNGGVTAIKNQRLGGLDYSSEANGAMPKADGTGYYVYTFNQTLGKMTWFFVGNDSSVAGPYSLTLSPAPIICGTFTTADISGYGSVNFTQDYSKMLIVAGASNCDGTNGSANGDNGRAYIFDMDLQTGTPTKLASWIVNAGSTAGTRSAYTADFSPENKYVYVSQIYPGRLVRYNIQTMSDSAIKSSEWIVGNTTTSTNTTYIGQSGGQIRRGPDNRMWIADRATSYYPNATSGTTAQCKLSYISAPDSPTNSPAAIGLKLDGLSLPTGACGIWGLSQVATVYKPSFVVY